MSLRAYAYVHVAHAAFKLSRKPRSLLDAVSTLSFCALDAISSYLENTTINHLNYCWQTSKRFWLAAHFLSISNTQVGRNTKEQKLQKDVHLCDCGGLKVTRNVFTFRLKGSTWHLFLLIFCQMSHASVYNSNSLDLCMLIIHTWRCVWDKRMLGAETGQRSLLFMFRVLVYVYANV